MSIKFNALPSQEYLKECLDYNPDTGIFVWKHRPLHHFNNHIGTYKQVNTQRAGKLAGCLNQESGYIMIGIDSVRYRAHRIAWKLITGEEPLFEIDHHDMDRSNCRFSDLRKADHSQNARNRREYSNNKLGFKGVSFNVKYGKYQSEIMKDRVRYNLGYYDNPVDAHNAYIEASKRLHGEFARAS